MELGHDRLELGGQLLERDGVAAPGGQPGRPAVEGLPQLEQGADVLEGDLGDHDAAAPVRLRETVGGEPAEGLADRRARDAEALRLLDLAEHLAREQPPFDDVLAQGLVGAVAGSHGSLLALVARDGECAADSG